MDMRSLKLECLKLAVAKAAHLGPDEVIVLASKYEGYCLSSDAKDKEQSIVGNSQEPTDSVKEHKKIHSKK